nr:GNAT family N-acetyltransferase [Paenibacillus castaneae]
MGAEHYDESMALSQFAFQYKKTEEELEQGKEQFLSLPADRWAVYVDGKYAAQATVLQLETYIGGQRFAMGGVAAVATWPEYRRQGLVAKLLVHSLKEMKANGQTLSFLHPFAFGFYRKFGWETYTDNKIYTIKSDFLPARVPYKGRIERYSNNYELLYHIYEAYAAQFNGSLVRSELWWKYYISKRKPGQISVYFDQNNQALGYIIYEVKNSQLFVHEFVSLSEESRKALWSFISQHDSMINEVKITVPSNDNLAYLLPNPRIHQEITPYFMARIVDAEAFIEKYTFDNQMEEDKLYIDLTDSCAPWNTGYYLLHIEPSGRARLHRLEKNEGKEMTIKMDIGTLTAVLLGYLRPLQLAQMERIEGQSTAIKRLHSRIPERTTYLPDFF